MSLYIERRGGGPDLVLLHGWGLHGGLWGPVIEPLADAFTLHILDLPGHGRSGPCEGDYTLENLAECIAAEVPEHAHWLGWSLGGRIALAAANNHAIDKLVLVGTTPCFIRRDDWPHAVEAEVLEGFARSLAEDYRATLKRFLAVQSQGSERGREELRALRDALFDHGEPSAAALAGGLAILRDADLRSLLPTIQQPTLWLHGERDTLAPIGAAKWGAAAMPNARLEAIPGAGHAPFISHPEAFVAAVKGFLHE